MLNTIYMIESEMENFHPINSIDLFLFEADLNNGENVQPQYQQNQGVLTNVAKMLMYLIEQAKKIVTGILSSAKSMVDYIFLSPEKKEEYNRYCAYVNSHPDAAKKQVTVKDWKKVSAGYDAAVQRAENLATKVANKQISKEDAQAEENSIFSDLSSLAGKAASVVTLDVALRYAKESTSNAKKVQAFLKYQPGLLDQMEKELGQKEMAGVQDKIAKMTRETYLSRLKSQIFSHKQKTLAQIMNEVIDEAAKVCQADNGFQKAVSTANLVKNNTAGVGIAARNLIGDKTTRQQLKTASTVKDIAGSYKDMVGQVKNLFTKNANL